MFLRVSLCVCTVHVCVFVCVFACVFVCVFACVVLHVCVFFVVLFPVKNSLTAYSVHVHVPTQSHRTSTYMFLNVRGFGITMITQNGTPFHHAHTEPN